MKHKQDPFAAALRIPAAKDRLSEFPVKGPARTARVFKTAGIIYQAYSVGVSQK